MYLVLLERVTGCCWQGSQSASLGQRLSQGALAARGGTARRRDGAGRRIGWPAACKEGASPSLPDSTGLELTACRSRQQGSGMSRASSSSVPGDSQYRLVHFNNGREAEMKFSGNSINTALCADRPAPAHASCVNRAAPNSRDALWQMHTPPSVAVAGLAAASVGRIAHTHRLDCKPSARSSRRRPVHHPFAWPSIYAHGYPIRGHSVPALPSLLHRLRA